MADGGKAVSKEVNASLKAAKEAIKQKEYKEALKHCKSVLKIDKTNYHALVFIGVCAKEMQQYEQSRAAYKKAVEQIPDQMLAWQGLCNLYEAANNEDWKIDLVEVYEKLINANKQEITKWRELLEKIISLLLSLGKPSEAMVYLKDLEGTSPEPSEDLLVHWQKTYILLQKRSVENVLSKELHTELENAFQSTIEYKRILGKELRQAHGEHVMFLCDCLKTTKDKEQSNHLEQLLQEKCKILLESFPDHENALNTLCRLHLEKLEDSLSEDVIIYVKKLKEINPESSLCKLGLAAIMIEQKKWMLALDLLKEIENLSGNYMALHCLLMAKIHLYLHDTKTCMKYVEKGISNADNCWTVSGCEAYIKALQILMAACLIEENKCKQAIEIIQKLLENDSDNYDGLCKLGEAYAVLEENSDAIEVSEKLLKLRPSSHHALAIKAMVSMNEGKFYDAELRLQEALELLNDQACYYLLLGQVYWQLRGEDPEYVKKAYNNLLQAAKLDPYSSRVFGHLGDYYREIIKDLKKAQKCYQKAFALNQLNRNAAMALGDVSIDLGDEKAAIEVYQSVTNNFGPGSAKVAWLRLGMLLTKQGLAERAITCFQSALRSDPKDRQCWECLGDAYVARGSYTSALKAFSRASEIDSTNIYCKYRIGSIKQILCVYAEAIEVFRNILKEKPDYIPALKGLAECHLRLEYDSLAENFDKRAVDHAEQVLHVAAKAIEIRQDLRCFWKMIGDAAFALHVLPKEKIRDNIPTLISKITGLTQAENDNTKVTVLDLSRRCYAVIVKLDADCASAWHDLAISSLHFGMTRNGEIGQSAIQQSIQFAKKAISLDPHNSGLWNTLGLITGTSDIANPELSQHAFIKAVTLEPQNAEAWTNLGALYLKYNKVQAAHEAFKKAQDADPSYTPAWIGQASIAERIGDADAMDLFRHSSELGSHSEGFLGYAKWVCFHLKDLFTKGPSNAQFSQRLGSPSESVRKAIVNSSVCARKFTERIPRSPCAFNLLGILLEHEKLFNQSVKAFETASKLLSTNGDIEKRNIVLSNTARVLRCAGQFNKSIDVYLQLQPLNKFEDIAGLGLSYFLAGKLEESFKAYEQALGLCQNENGKSDILTAMGIIAFALDKVDMAKTLFFRSSQTEAPSALGLIALAALGLLSKDHTSTNAALAEIERHAEFNTEDVQNDFCFLKSAMHLLQGSVVLAKRAIQKAVRRYPHSKRQWNNLAKFLHQRMPKTAFEVSGRCALISSQLEPSHTSAMLVSATSIGSKSFAADISRQTLFVSSSRAAQRVVHSHPGRPEAWALLATATFAFNFSKRSEPTTSLSISTSRLALQKAEENLVSLEETLRASLSQQLTSTVLVAVNLRVWTIKQLICSNLMEGAYEMALLLCENAMTQYEESPDVYNELLFLKLITLVLFSSSQGDEMEAVLKAAKEICDSDGESIWKYQVLSSLYIKLGLPYDAELLIRQCVLLSSQQGVTSKSLSSLSRLALISLWCSVKDSNKRWTELATEAITEASKLNNGNVVVEVLKIALCHIQGESKQAVEILLQINDDNCSFLSDLLLIWKKIYQIKKQEDIVDTELVEVQNWE